MNANQDQWVRSEDSIQIRARGFCVLLSSGKDLEWVEFIAFIRMIATHIHKKRILLKEMVAKEATGWIVEDVLIKLKIKEEITVYKCSRHVSCLDYDPQSLLETLVKHWTNVETN